MEQKLNTYKTYKDKGLLVVIGMILAYIMMLLPLCRWGFQKAESETETAGTMENEFPFSITSNTKFCEEEIVQELRNTLKGIQDHEWAFTVLGGTCEYELERFKRAEENRNTEWYPWKLNEEGTAQEMPVVMTANWSHEAFKELATAYGLDAWTIWQVENHYWIKEGVILCITVAETSWWNRGYGEKNIGSVWSNDRGDRPTYALMESGLEAIGKTLTNRYLGKVQTLGCLSNAWSCQSRDDKAYRYATSDGNWERNMVACLSTIYGSINPSEFNIRR